MKVNIRSLAHALFWPYSRRAIDLHNGSILSPEEYLPKQQKEENSVRIIPFFTPALVRQSYLDEVKQHLNIDLTELDRYPRYHAVPLMDKSEDNSADYCYRAGELCEEIDNILSKDRMNTSPQYDPHFPYSEEYGKKFILQFAKDWCRKEGYEWYEE